MTAATAYLITASASAVLAWVAWRWTYETTAWNRNARRNKQILLMASLLFASAVSLVLGLSR